jgi:lysozyme family protein
VADFNTAFTATMVWEDSKMECAEVPDAPPGARAISGINSSAWPQEFAAIAAVSQNERPPAVESFYLNHFWNKFIQQMDHAIAVPYFDTCVNLGAGKATTILQDAVNVALHPPVAVDGSLGPDTIRAVNLCNPAALAANFRQLRVAHYQDHDAHSPFLEQLIARAKS